MSKNISISVIKRLPRYYRFLERLKAAGLVRISSSELASKMGLTASQIRQDFNCFGGFGQQGYGYNIEQLHKEIGTILGVGNLRKAIIIGAGNLGRALAAHVRFESKGFSLIGIFDKKESMAGQLVGNFPVRHIDGLDEFCRGLHPDIAVLCVPEDQAGIVGKQLIRLGIKGIWNFSHFDFAAEGISIPVENVHLGDSLMTLCYRVNRED